MHPVFFEGKMAESIQNNQIDNNYKYCIYIIKINCMYGMEADKFYIYLTYMKYRGKYA